MRAVKTLKKRNRFLTIMQLPVIKGFITLLDHNAVNHLSLLVPSARTSSHLLISLSVLYKSENHQRSTTAAFSGYRRLALICYMISISPANNFVLVPDSNVVSQDHFKFKKNQSQSETLMISYKSETISKLTTFMLAVSGFTTM